MSVYCYDLAPQKRTFWTKERDKHLMSFYNDQVKIDPAILAYKLGTRELDVLRRLADLKLRKRCGGNNECTQ
jgi:hypothetical protein